MLPMALIILAVVAFVVGAVMYLYYKKNPFGRMQANPAANATGPSSPRFREAGGATGPHGRLAGAVDPNDAPPVAIPRMRGQGKAVQDSDSSDTDDGPPKRSTLPAAAPKAEDHLLRVGGSAMAAGGTYRDRRVIK